MLNRRDLLSVLPAWPLAWLGISQAAPAADAPPPNAPPLLAGPPVVQHLSVEGFAVSFAVGQLATGWVEWGLSPERLDQRVIPSRAGLVDASDRAIVVPVSLGDRGAPGRRVFYRVAAQPLGYQSAYKLRRGEAVAGPVHSVTLPDPAAPRVRVAVVNDTHEHLPTVDALAARIEAVAPDVVVWNGDTCASAFDSPADLPRVLLKPGWAASRSLVFVPGNHDVRGASARQIEGCLAPGSEPGLPYNLARRSGPVALLTLDTGEDKPDAHPVFAGTAAYEPYRLRQAAWLREALRRPEIASAPFKVVFCHIPLRGLPKQNDGLSLEGYASWSGDGARAWMPVLREANVPLIVSGHMHAWRVDEPSGGHPMQVVGGGPDLHDATLIVLEADAQTLRVTIQDLSGAALAERHVTRD
ncbi:MAG: metallophosphoesterase [Candidatus Anammoximicrobium sp.]|mgnify:CR=1 FL=1|nr:metallophosphoesterase [Candidatus Anammoximicrobium sp.]